MKVKVEGRNLKRAPKNLRILKLRVLINNQKQSEQTDNAEYEEIKQTEVKNGKLCALGL